MRVAFLAIEEAAQAERAGQRAVHRLVEHQVARCARAEGAVGASLLGQFALDALEVLGQRVDLALVLQRDALLLVMLGADVERQVLAGRALAHLDLLRTRLHRQRNADDGDPVAPFLMHHQYRLALVGRAWRLGTVAQLDDGHAAGHRFVQRTADEAFGVGGQAEEGGEQQAERSKHFAFRKQVVTGGAGSLHGRACRLSRISMKTRRRCL
ncbi:hypothetical protein D9M71_389030 [compost metagenome]